MFPDEIGDLPLAIQVKLLRVLQERDVVRLGSHKNIATNVRLRDYRGAWAMGRNILRTRIIKSQ